MHEEVCRFLCRAARSEYWWFVLCEILIVVGVSILSEKFDSLAALGLLMPAIAVGVRRLHESGHRGWWLLVGAIPAIGNLVLLFWAVQPSQAGANEFDS